MEKITDSNRAAKEEAEFVNEISGLRTVLRGYVLALLPHHGACDDVVQETCLFLWERRDECGEETNLKAWAFSVARFKAMAYRRDHLREKTVFFSEERLHQIAGAAELLAEGAHERLLALRSCLARLSPAEISLLRLKYVDRGSLSDYARSMKQQPSRVQKTLSRLRLSLRYCIETRLSSE